MDVDEELQDEELRHLAAELDARGGSSDEVDLQGMLASVHVGMAQQDRGLGGWLRTRPTWLRRSVLWLVLSVPLWLAMGRGLRTDWRSLNIEYLVSAAVALTVGGGLCAWLATRPLQRSALSRGTDWLLFAAAVLGMVAVALLGDSGESLTGAELARGALACGGSGVLMVLPAVITARLLDRGTLSAPLLTAAAAALMANVGLLLRCPVSDAAHCLTGHVGVTCWIGALMVGLRRWI